MILSTAASFVGLDCHSRTTLPACGILTSTTAGTWQRGFMCWRRIGGCAYREAGTRDLPLAALCTTALVDFIKLRDDMLEGGVGVPEGNGEALLHSHRGKWRVGGQILGCHHRVGKVLRWSWLCGGGDDGYAKWTHPPS